MERSFGRSFGDVRVHTDSKAAETTRSHGAAALAVGSNVSFAPGRYQPDTPKGERLIAHELTHVAQQSASGGTATQASRESVSSASEPAEIEAESNAERVARGQPARVTAGITTRDRIMRRALGVGDRPLGSAPLTASAGPIGATPASAPIPAPAEPIATPTVARVAEQRPAVAAQAEVAPAAQTEEAEQEQASAGGSRSGRGGSGGGGGASASSSGPSEIVASGGELELASAEPSGESEAATVAGGGGHGSGGGGGPPGAEQRLARDQERMQTVLARASDAAVSEAGHEPASESEAVAQTAAAAPANEAASVAQTQQVGVMDQQEAGEVDETSFFDLLMSQLERIAPSNLEEMDEFSENGGASQIRGELQSGVAGQTQSAAGDIQAAANAEPDASSVQLPEQGAAPEAPAAPARPDLEAEQVAPTARSPEELSVQHNVDEADRLMAENDVSDEQLRRANEPRFTEVADARGELQEHADQVPAQAQAVEAEAVAEAEAGAREDEAASVDGMRAEREAARTEVLSQQSDAQREAEAQRQEVADHIEQLFTETQTEVQGQLETLQTETLRRFDEAEVRARANFESYVDREMTAYKDDRYSGLGAVRWLTDKLLGLPDEVNRFYEQGRAAYIDEMRGALRGVSTYVDDTLAAVNRRIAEGRAAIDTYVAELPSNLRDAGETARGDMQSRFDTLEQSVEDARNELANALVQRYQAALESLDTRIAELQAANGGLLDAFIGKLMEIVRILIDFKNRIAGMLRQGADTVMAIVADPIGFLGNLLDAVLGGLQQFLGNILGHLQAGIMGWLFGTMASAGIQMPTEFSLRALFGLVAQILGFTPENIRRRLGRIIGERNVMALEYVLDSVMVLMREGPAGLWEQIQDQLADFREVVISGIRDWVIRTVISQGVQWLVSLLVPAAALLKAIMAIFNVVTFLIERINQILDFVQSVLDSVSSIVNGDPSSAKNYIEQTLGRTVPIIIGFIANLLGLGGIANTIRRIIERLQDRIWGAFERLVRRMWQSAGRLLSRATGRGERQPATAGERQNLEFANQAKQRLAQAPREPMDYATLRRTKEAEARRIEQDYNRRIARPMRMSIIMPAAAADQRDNDLDFTVRIAPNTTSVTGQTTTPKPATVVTKGLSSGRASWVRAAPLSSEGVEGTTPEEDPKGWNHVRTIDPSSRYWVRMHLLNHNLKGAGKAWNLTPGRKTTNSAHHSGAEREAKNRVTGGDVLWYLTRVWYHSGPVIEDFPRRIETKWGTYSDGKTVRSWSVDVDAPPANSIVELKYAGVTQLKTVLPERLAAAIVHIRLQMGGFGSATELQTRLRAHYDARGVDPAAYNSDWSTINAKISAGQARI